ncbi:MAG: polyprenyl diphosphate synthase [Candidatus Roizmanbacteria bacterium]|nr:polyprenyl diphosphate synthase [Candidatus Roizmanbacteria bacterium]
MQKLACVPHHVAIIPDGNRRWARARNLNTLFGHRAGFDRAVELAKAARDMGVHTLSIWAFSTENWDRGMREVSYLMRLYETMIDNYLKDAHKDGVRIIHLGRKDRIPKRLSKKIEQAEKETKHNNKHVLNICLDYGGQDEILRAMQSATKDTQDLAQLLDTKGQPYPLVDLLIRTSGEQRTSGLLLWQSAYAELYWEPAHFPDFTPEKLQNALFDYSRRRRRFGGDGAEIHLAFNPKIVAHLEIRFRHALAFEEGERFRDLTVRYIKEHYGLSKQLAIAAGADFAKALRYGKQQHWAQAKASLTILYGIIQKTIGLAFEPDFIASIEVDLWQKGNTEEKMQELLAEKFRISVLQAAQPARAAIQASELIKKQDFQSAQPYLEQFYTLLKERVA